MLILPTGVRIFVASEPTDLRRSFDRLAAMARDVIRQDPLSGHLFVFFNRTGHRVKILFFDRTGFVLWYKRLESGIFRLPAAKEGAIELDARQLSLLLDGIHPAGPSKANVSSPAEP